MLPPVELAELAGALTELRRAGRDRQRYSARIAPAPIHIYGWRVLSGKAKAIERTGQGFCPLHCCLLSSLRSTSLRQVRRQRCSPVCRHLAFLSCPFCSWIVLGVISCPPLALSLSYMFASGC